LVPFLQALRAIEKYRGTAWADSPLATPFAFVVLSATPPRDILEDSLFPGAEREQALDHPVLRERLQASRPAGPWNCGDLPQSPHQGGGRFELQVELQPRAGRMSPAL
jgi:hypothetical protein